MEPVLNEYDGKLGFQNLIVNPMQADMEGNFSASHFCSAILALAASHAESLGLGMKWARQTGLAWVLTRLRLRFEKPTKLSESVRIETWINDVSSSLAIRNFNLINSKGEITGGASSTWMQINMSSRKPAIISESDMRAYCLPDRNCPASLPGKIEWKLPAMEMNRVKVAYSDIDIQQHVNSVRYIDWMCNQFSQDHYKSYFLSDLEINYLAECMYGDDLSIEMAEALLNCYTVLILKDGRPACAGRLNWHKK